MNGEDVYQEEKGRTGGDIYVKGSWELRTSRYLIGDDDFWKVTRMLVYGRSDPKPGNFKPRFASTPEYVANVNKVTGKDLTWFFDVYLREAALPELVETRAGDRLDLRWKTPKDKPFALPVEVAVNGKVQRVEMNGGTGSMRVPSGAHVLVDPAARILKRSASVEAFQNFMMRRGS